jgi:hypothetical protein
MTVPGLTSCYRVQAAPLYTLNYLIIVFLTAKASAVKIANADIRRRTDGVRSKIIKRSDIPLVRLCIVTSTSFYLAVRGQDYGEKKKGTTTIVSQRRFCLRPDVVQTPASNQYDSSTTNTY